MTDQPAPDGVLDIQPRPELGLGLPSPERVRARRAQARYRRFDAPELPHPRWASYSSQRHVRDIALDGARGQVWLATWGGVLCWRYAERLCVRHTSEHGLLGNPVRCITVDAGGVVWAGQDGGLCSLAPEATGGWRHHEKLRGSTVLRLAPRPGGGVYLALRDADGHHALAEVAPDGTLAHRRCVGLVSSEIAALLAGEDGALWVGNAWGLHRYASAGETASFDLSLDAGGQKEVQVRVRSLAPGPDGGLWVGTNWGLYQLHPGRNPAHAPVVAAPHDEVLALAPEPGSGALWVATAREIGRLEGDDWRPLGGRLPEQVDALVSAEFDGVRRTWAGGGAGLDEIGADTLAPALLPAPEDTLSNTVRCLWAEERRVWVGTAQGLYAFDGQSWEAVGAPNVRDVRALVPAHGGERLWVGTWRSGLCLIDRRVYIPVQTPGAPIVALATSASEGLWAATPDTVHWRESDAAPWRPLALEIGGASIQTLCYQAATTTLWVGTSRGLFSYQVDAGLPNLPPEPLGGLSARALALDPLTGQLWVGTSAGLYSQHAWKRHLDDDVRALAFGPADEGALWVGTSSGLKQWPAPGDGHVFAAGATSRFAAENSGLAADPVTALAVSTCGQVCEVWIGAPAGLSRYRYRET
jgi:ligand-binding sensor domain-containing protein